MSSPCADIQTTTMRPELYSDPDSPMMILLRILAFALPTPTDHLCDIFFGAKFDSPLKADDPSRLLYKLRIYIAIKYGIRFDEVANPPTEKKHIGSFAHVELGVHWAAGMLRKHGYNIDPRFWHVDIHNYVLDSPAKNKMIAAGKKKVEYMDLDGCSSTPFKWHIDDCGGVRWPCCTLIVYLNVEGISGGSFMYRDSDRRIQMIECKTNLIIMMRGDIPHKPTSIVGPGQRLSIVFQIKRVD
mgnify:CR=1 FL=1